MAELLHRVGRTAFRRRWLVVLVWFAVLGLSMVAFAIGGGAPTAEISIPGTPTARVAARLATDLPEAAGGSGTIVFSTTAGAPLTDAQRAAIGSAIETAAGTPGVVRIVDPFTAEADRAAQAQAIADGRTRLDQATAQLDDGQAQLDAGRAQAEAAGVLDQYRSQIDARQAEIDAGRAQVGAQRARVEAGAALLDLAAGIRLVSQDGATAMAPVVFTTSQMEVPAATRDGLMAAFAASPIAGVEVDFSSSIASGIPDILGPAEVVGVVVAAVVLFVMLGTLVAAGLPIITALTGVAIGTLGSLALSGVVDMISVTPVLGVMLGLAVGIDYALFIINRHRRQLLDGYAVEESIALADGTSGNAVVFAGSTVIIALLALNVTGIPFLGLMGTVAAACVAIAVLVAVTLTPALLAIAGMRVLRGGERTRLAVSSGPVPTTPARPMSTRAAVGRAALGIAVLAVLALPVASMRLGLPVGSAEAADSTQYRAYDTIATKFGDGANGPLLVVADLPEAPAEEATPAAQLQVAQAIAAFPDVVAVAPVATSDDRTVLAFQVVPREGPTSESTERLVHALRAASPIDGGIELGVAGQASGNIDISQTLADALPLYLLLVVGLSLLIMVGVFRSLVVPLIATGGFVLSLFAALGGVVAIYQWGWLGGVFGVGTPAPILDFLPTVLVGVLFGLAMDYMLFLATGMREAFVHGATSRTAVVLGFRAGRRVVTAAALIMIAVFGGFVFSESALIRPVGFALAFGVLVDAFLVRLLIVPALMHLAGDRAWWLPRWLDRVLPDVDIEGAALARTHPHIQPEHRASPDAATGG